MRTCPRCGYVDAVQVAASDKYEKTKRPKRHRGEYMREYRKRAKKAAKR